MKWWSTVAGAFRTRSKLSHRYRDAIWSRRSISICRTAAEEQLKNSVTNRGVIISMDPNNGEILALASAPTFDPNLFSQRITTKEGRAEYAALLNDPETPLLNRAIQSRYPPGSTWKIPMAIAGLKQGAITLEHSNLVCGGGIQVGNKFTRCMGNHGSPDIKDRDHSLLRRLFLSSRIEDGYRRHRRNG